MAVNVQLQKPTGGTFEQPLRPGMCIGICRKITDGEETSYGPTMYWWWEPRYTTGSDPKKTEPAAFDADGSPWLLRDMTSTKFGKGKTIDKTAKARVRVEALLKREIDDEEDLSGILDQCINKAAILYLTEQNGYLNVTMVQPYKAGTLAPIPPAEDGESFDDPSDDGNAELPF